MAIVTQLDLLKKRRTKIIATLGPASREPAVIRELIQAGANVFRLNMSHGDHAFHRECFDRVRHVAEEMREPIAVFADLCGPKIRTGRFRDGGIKLRAGARVTVTTREVMGEDGLIPSQYQALAGDVKPGDRILLADGTLQLRVESIAGTEIECTVIQGGMLKDHKGINLPGVAVSAPSLTAKDRDDARFAMELGVDFLALSFVRSGNDIHGLKRLIAEAGQRTPVIAKIEKPEALDDMERILKAADAIMIARGDLGVELSPEQVPIAQNQLIDRAQRSFRPVIVATQMLESMIDNARPTRAEVSDVATAVTAGADAIMLSGETAVGAYPVEAVRMMDRVARHTESYLWRHGGFAPLKAVAQKKARPLWDAFAGVTARLAQDLKVRAIVVITKSGMSAVTMASARPAAPIVGVTGAATVCRRMNLSWGVIPVLAPEAGEENPNVLARRIARELDLAASGGFILLVRGFHSDPQLNTPSLTVLAV
jgi:pyruvate kinase